MMLWWCLYDDDDDVFYNGEDYDGDDDDDKTDQLNFDQQLHFLSVFQLLPRHMGFLILIIMIKMMIARNLIMMIEIMIMIN